MANLKKISELSTATSTDGLQLLVNDNGVAKQIAASSVGAQADWSVMDNSDPAYIKNKPYINSIYVIDSESYTYGDDALNAILRGEQILIKVPNKNSESTLFANFMPVLQYQLPNENNNYLVLFYLKDGIAENILTALQTGSFEDAFGSITMMLSQTYEECPLKASPIV